MADTKQKVAFVSDHAGAAIRANLVAYINANLENWEAIDLRPTVTAETPVDYPDYAWALAEFVECSGTEKGYPGPKITYGVAICGTGNGMAMTLNSIGGTNPKSKQLAGLAWTPEIARLIRAHNNARYLCLPARFLTFDEAIRIVKVFLATSFEGEEETGEGREKGNRHQRRLSKICQPSSSI